MTQIVADVMRHLNNYFESGYLKQTFRITGGVISPGECFRPGYVAVSGSFYHNGVWILKEDGTLEGDQGKDESFCGKIWFLNPPQGFLALCEEIGKFAEKTPAGAFESESFEGYSYTRTKGKNGLVIGWEDAFQKKLMPYRKMFTEVCY